MESSKEHYTVQDFLTDPEFKEWVLHGRGAAGWNDFIRYHPHKAEEIRTARQLLLTLATPSLQSSEEMRREAWRFISLQIDEPTAMEPTAEVPRRSVSRYLPWLAAACALFILSVVLYSYFGKTTTSYQIYYTEAGQEKRILLPDSTEVLLVGQSQLRHSAEWDEDAPREVWVEGNAYFDVKKTCKPATEAAPHDHFVVHTESAGRVEVLGTTFSVSKISDRVVVHLQSGSIRFSYEDQALLLSPGEAAELSAHRLTRQPASPLTALWNTKELVLDGAPLREVIDLYQKVFGTAMNLPKTVDLDQLLDGTIPFGSPEEAVEALSMLLNTPFTLQTPIPEH